MFVILPLLSLVLLVLIFRHTESWRISVLSGAVVWGVLVTAITEILSIFKLITFSSVLAIWAIVNIILIFWEIGLIKKHHLIAQNGNANIDKPESPPKKPIYFFILLFGVVFVAGTVGLIALIAPTNTWDSMAYHMPRVVQ